MSTCLYPFKLQPGVQQVAQVRRAAAEPMIGKLNPIDQIHTAQAKHMNLSDYDLAAGVLGVPSLALSTSWS